jgi:hypothetical protein
MYVCVLCVCVYGEKEMAHDTVLHNTMSFGNCN